MFLKFFFTERHFNNVGLYVYSPVLIIIIVIITVKKQLVSYLKCSKAKDKTFAND